MINDPLQNRKYVIIAIIVGVILIYILRLFSLQIIETKYKQGAESNAFLKKTLFPPRGMVYDRNNTLLVYNKPAYDIMLIMREIKSTDTLELCKSLNITRDFFENRILDIKDKRKNPGYSSYTPQLFMSQLNIEDIATFQQMSYKFNGFYIQKRSLREYIYPNAGQVLGSIGEVSKKRIENDDYYKQGDFAGRDGIEYTYEKELRGTKGVEILLRDAKGRIKGRYEDGAYDVASKSGSNLTLTLDIELQKLGERLMNGKMGSIVAIEPKTGEILALVSSPTYDPSLLVGRQRSKNYTILANDINKPLFNRATQAQYPPGSTFKMFQALVALQMGGITTNSLFSCNGVASQPIKCTHAHGSPVNIYGAIEQSCNPYFWNSLRSTLEKDGYGEKNEKFKENVTTWEELMKSFGFGGKITDSDIYEQSKGYIPGVKFYNRWYGETGWRAITIRSISIGQGEVSLTPLQLANGAAVIANDGYYIAPHLNKADSMLSRRHEVPIDKQNFDIVKEGMRRMMENTGSGAANKIPGITMGGKTGTSQNPHGKDHSVFICMAPLEDPKIVVATIVENSGFGATYALPISTLIVEKYLLGEIERQDLLQRTENTILNPNVKRY